MLFFAVDCQYSVDIILTCMKIHETFRLRYKINFHYREGCSQDKMAQMMAMRKTLDERARKKALDAIFNRFDYNQNGAVVTALIVSCKAHISN